MAFNTRKIFPIDTRPGTGIGVSIPFNNPGVFKSTYFTKDAVRNNLIHFFLTNQGELYLNPLFGGNLRAFIFQQITDNNLDDLKENIQSQIISFFPSIEINSLEIYTIDNSNQVNVELKYNIRNTGIVDTVEIAFT
jgi:phage baseplate assembly protein W